MSRLRRRALRIKSARVIGLPVSSQVPAPVGITDKFSWLAVFITSAASSAEAGDNSITWSTSNSSLAYGATKWALGMRRTLSSPTTRETSRRMRACSSLEAKIARFCAARSNGGDDEVDFDTLNVVGSLG